MQIEVNNKNFNTNGIFYKSIKDFSSTEFNIWTAIINIARRFQ
jgi:hypothetical protein